MAEVVNAGDKEEENLNSIVNIKNIGIYDLSDFTAIAEEISEFLDILKKL